MSKQLPTSGFKWMIDDELDDWKHLSCILEVYLKYSKQLHDLHSDYPPSAERITIGNVEKLFPNLNSKTNYVVHYENLNYTSVYKLQKFIKVLNSKKVPAGKIH